MAFRRDITYKRKPLLVRREPRGCIYVFDQLPGRSATYGYLEQVPLGANALPRHIIDIVAVPREGHPQVTDLRRRHDLNITCGVDPDGPKGSASRSRELHEQRSDHRAR